MITDAEHEIDILKRKLAVTEELLENLKCCGNCKHYRYGNLCAGKMVSHDSCCDNWIVDGLIRNDRELSER